MSRTGFSCPDLKFPNKFVQQPSKQDLNKQASLNQEMYTKTRQPRIDEEVISCELYKHEHPRYQVIIFVTSGITSVKKLG